MFKINWLQRFQPKTVPSLIAGAMFIVLIGLGMWQVERLAWKNEMISAIKEKMSMKPVPLPEKIKDPSSWEHRRVSMVGNFMHGSDFLVRPRTLDGKPGYHMITPFQRASGGIVLVNRGWISDELMKKAQNLSGMRRLEGVIEVPMKSDFTPDNNPAKEEWYWADIGAMAKTAKLKNVIPVLVTLPAGKAGVYPVGGKLRVEDIPNNHQQYAVFWFAMAFILAIIWVLSSLNPPLKVNLQFLLKLKGKNASL